MVVYDEDPVGSDDHVDNVYAEEYLSPGHSISQVVWKKYGGYVCGSVWVANL